MKFQGLLNACNLKVVQLRVLKNLTTPSLFGDTADTPIFFDQPMQDFSNDQSVTTVNEGVMASHQPLQPSHYSADLQDTSSSAGTSSRGRVRKMSRAMAESVSQ